MPIHRGVVRLEQQCSRLQGGLAELHATTGLQLNSMREMFRHRGMRLIFTANLISMIGSGMNSAAVIWYILQATHSEVSLAALIALQTLPSMLLLPFTGVLIDREDRRHLMLWLDSARGGHHLLRRHAGVHSSCSAVAPIRHERPGCHRFLDVLPHR